jgi:hypothetical protein
MASRHLSGIKLKSSCAQILTSKPGMDERASNGDGSALQNQLFLSYFFAW